MAACSLQGKWPYRPLNKTGSKTKNPEHDYLRAIIATVARSAFPPDELAKFIVPKGMASGRSRPTTYATASTPKAQIAAPVPFNQGNLSRSISRCIDEGIVVRVGELPVHVYRLPDGGAAKKTRKKNGD